MKNKKAGYRIWQDIEELAALVRSGEKTWQELDLDDVDVRTKWAGLFHRKKRAAGTFMMRLKVSPTASQLPGILNPAPSDAQGHRVEGLLSHVFRHPSGPLLLGTS